MTLTEQDLTKFEEALRREHHSEFRWTNTVCAILIAEVRLQRERLAVIEEAVKPVLRAQDFPPSDERARTFASLGMLFSEPF